MGILSLLSSGTSAAPEENFWRWFVKNESMIFHFESNREEIFDQLSHELDKVNTDLTFEFGPVMAEGRRAFVISADGVVSAFPAVDKLAAAAPDLERWIIVKFRPRRNPINNIEINGVLVKADEVRYQLYADDGKLGILMFLNGYSEAEAALYAHIGYLLLDEAIGEYDVETKLGFIEFSGTDSEHFGNAQPLRYLAEQVDGYFSQ